MTTIFVLLDLNLSPGKVQLMDASLAHRRLWNLVNGDVLHKKNQFKIHKASVLV